MRGIGTRDSVLIDIIGHRTREQRMMIVAEYRRAVGRDLLRDLESETSGNYRSILLKLMMPRDEMLATLLHEAMAGAGTNDGVLIDIMTQFPYEIQAAAAAYHRKFGRSLESAIKSETSGNYEKILITLLTTPRPLPNTVDPNRAVADAETFYRAGEGRLGTDERTYMTIVANNSREQLLLMDQNYRRTHGKGTSTPSSLRPADASVIQCLLASLLRICTLLLVLRRLSMVQVLMIFLSSLHSSPTNALISR